MKNSPQSKKQGSAVLLTLVAIVILLAMGAGLLSLGLRARILSTRNVEQIQARCAADAGLAKAVFKLNEKLKISPTEIGAAMKQTQSPSPPPLPGTTDEGLPNCDATFSYKITSAGIYATLGKKGLTVESIGKCGCATTKVYAFLGLKGLFDNAILVQNRISLMPNTLVAGYNSADPTDTDKAKSSIFGSVYAPNVDITLYPSAEMRGAIIGDSVIFKSGCTFYYDEALKDNVSVDDEGVRFVVKRWREE